MSHSKIQNTHHGFQDYYICQKTHGTQTRGAEGRVRRTAVRTATERGGVKKVGVDDSCESEYSVLHGRTTQAGASAAQLGAGRVAEVALAVHSVSDSAHPGAGSDPIRHPLCKRAARPRRAA